MKEINISQLLATPDGQYINGEVTGYLTQIRPPNGKGPSKAKLSDGSHEIAVSLWGGGVSHWEGRKVHFSGKGMKIQEYKGTKSLSVGDKVTISGAPEADSIPGDPQPPAPRSVAQMGGSVSPAVHGATVGASINKAVDIWIATNTEGHAWTESSATLVEKWARQLIEIHTAMERGEPPVNIPF